MGFAQMMLDKNKWTETPFWSVIRRLMVVDDENNFIRSKFSAFGHFLYGGPGRLLARPPQQKKIICIE